MAAVAFARSPLPSIHVSLAPYQSPPAEEPKSPFQCLSPISPAEEDEGPRSALLTPPPVLSPGRPSPLSPLRPSDAPVTGTGLERERFEALLKTSRERNAMIGGPARKAQDLRKEIALKAHKSKQSERRALFLSKLQAPPSPSAAMTPKTPPESPAILHYSLPSPGLCSPLAMYETLAEAEQLPAKSKGWVEQVDFRLPEGERVQPYRKVPSGRGKPLPSLAQISARFGSQGQVPQVHIVLPDTAEKVDMAPKRRLPSFLQKATPALASVEVPVRKESLLIQEPVVVITPAPEPTRARKLLSIGRLKAPTPVVVPVAEPVKVEAVQSLEVSKKQDVLKSPGAPSSPKIRITTTVVPRTSSTSPVDLTESNLTAFNSLVDTRVHTGKNMLSTLRRRSHMPTMGAMFGRGTVADDSMLNVNTNGSEDSDVQKFVRRRSSPAELPRRERRDFAHPVLALPGAF